MTNANEVLGKNVYRVEPVNEPGYDWFILASSMEEAQGKIGQKQRLLWSGTKVTLLGAVEDLVDGIEVGKL